MPIFEIVFYVFSLVMLAGAVTVILVRNPVYAALALVLTFFSASAIWIRGHRRGGVDGRGIARDAVGEGQVRRDRIPHPGIGPGWIQQYQGGR
jgi:hypothetical protein